ncbi:hydroxyphenylacetyl-CoA thioesterase PaaI [Novosphingobium pentaromativorans]|uniref:Phenylacetic acid degradation protein PaaD n=1 Tax=Novosphingobium pentaromativorans US6-1 TaxID=1088721 RepID=G6EHI4_9SPHN|nr:hydroxyphenylacetyl-CoA thioesterase PaaI [Novosphingobium pentaromativorans]AIT81865.1 phenylacetic acid degradation protein PaaD [Novosphingobium pentaromativorans US6-1]EHJ59473.1 phenylacetic acid degradation protein PaaD [Novosphingobium pentaromativorans US6-1]
MTEPTPAEIAAELFAREGTGKAWDLTIEEVEEGFARVSMPIRTDMTNGHRTIHGGMIFALADTAFAYACNSRNVATVAQGASIVFLAPASEGETLVAEARELALSGRSGAYSVSVATGDGRAVAQFQGHSRAIGGAVIAKA